METLNKVRNIFKVNTEDTRTTSLRRSDAFIINLTPCFSVSGVKYELPGFYLSASTHVAVNFWVKTLNLSNAKLSHLK